MKKRDFKSIAAMGLALGLVLSANSVEATEGVQTLDFNTMLAAACGGGKCGHYTNTSYTQHSCGGAPSNPQYYNGSQQGPVQYYNGNQHSCGGVPMQGPVYGGTQHSCGSQPGNQGWYTADNGKGGNGQGQMTRQAPMSEQELKDKLNSETKSIYDSMTPEGKALALKLANQSCKGQNSCAGLGSCKSDDHSCAGQNSCAGKGIGPFNDKNLAVKVAAQKMAQKRGQTNAPTNAPKSNW